MMRRRVPYSSRDGFVGQEGARSQAVLKRWEAAIVGELAYTDIVPTSHVHRCPGPRRPVTGKIVPLENTGGCNVHGILSNPSRIPAAGFVLELLTNESFFDAHVLGHDTHTIQSKKAAPPEAPPYTSVPYFNQAKGFPGLFSQSEAFRQAVGVFTVEKPHEGDGPIPLRLIFWPKWLNDCLPKPLRLALMSHIEMCFLLSQLLDAPWYSFISDLKNWFYQIPLPEFIQRQVQCEA
jgi:hypothetical protein